MDYEWGSQLSISLQHHLLNFIRDYYLPSLYRLCMLTLKQGLSTWDTGAPAVRKNFRIVQIMALGYANYGIMGSLIKKIIA